MALLLSNPIPRSRIVLEKAATMVLYSISVGVATFDGVALGSVLGDLGMSVGNIAATARLQVMVGLVFCALEMALECGYSANGRQRYSAQQVPRSSSTW